MNIISEVYTQANYYPICYDKTNLSYVDNPLIINLDPENTFKKFVESNASKILICITVYNEPGEAVLYSLAGICNNINHLIAHGKTNVAKAITLCFIFDGHSKMSSSAISLLSSLDIYNPNLILPQADIHIYDSYLDSKLIYHKIEFCSLTNKNNIWQDVYKAALQDTINPQSTKEIQEFQIRVVIFIKEKNQGKLNSHWWFFNCLSKELSPIYCVQMDVGSVPKAQSLDILWEFMENHPNVGAASGSILVPAPKNCFDLLSIWQAGNFCVDKILFTPTEAISGYISVLPGQFSILRWAALLPRVNINPKTSAENPLLKYFRGLDPKNIFEANMFLTEDRILCFEMVTSGSQDWSLAHLPSVVAITDPCQSLQELLQQRRRWVNGSFVCQIWLFAQISRYLQKKTSAITNKVKLFSSLPLYLYRIFNTWFHPSLSFLILLEFYRYAKTVFFNKGLPVLCIDSIFLGACVLFSANLYACFSNTINSLLWRLTIIYYFLCLITVLSISIYDGFYDPIILIMTICILIYLTSQIHVPQLTKPIFKYLPSYLAIQFSGAGSIFKYYALSHFYDLSWGTKGLVTQEKELFSRWKFLLLWLASNIFYLVIASCFFTPLLNLTLFYLESLFVSIFFSVLLATRILFQSLQKEKR